MPRIEDPRRARCRRPRPQSGAKTAFDRRPNVVSGQVRLARSQIMQRWYGVVIPRIPRGEQLLTLTRRHPFDQWVKCIPGMSAGGGHHPYRSPRSTVKLRRGDTSRQRRTSDSRSSGSDGSAHQRSCAGRSRGREPQRLARRRTACRGRGRPGHQPKHLRQDGHRSDPSDRGARRRLHRPHRPSPHLHQRPTGIQLTCRHGHPNRTDRGGLELGSGVGSWRLGVTAALISAYMRQ
jgi:hypothetical protein